MGVINKISEDCSRELVTVTFDRLPPRIHCFNFNIYGAKQNPYMLPSEILIIDFMRTTNSPAAVLAWYLLRTFFCTHYPLRRPINATISDYRQIFIAEHRLSPFTSRMSSYRFLSCILRDPTVTHCSQGLSLITLLHSYHQFFGLYPSFCYFVLVSSFVASNVVTDCNGQKTDIMTNCAHMTYPSNHGQI